METIILNGGKQRPSPLTTVCFSKSQTIRTALKTIIHRHHKVAVVGSPSAAVPGVATAAAADGGAGPADKTATVTGGACGEEESTSKVQPKPDDGDLKIGSESGTGTQPRHSTRGYRSSAASDARDGDGSSSLSSTPAKRKTNTLSDTVAGSESRAKRARKGR